MILDVLSGILIVWLIIFVIACTFALVLMAIGMYKENIKDIVSNFKNSKGE